MWHRRILDELNVDGRRPKGVSVEYAVVVERVVPGNRDERRRQAAQRSGFQRRHAPVISVSGVQLIEFLHVGGGQNESVCVGAPRFRVVCAGNGIQEGLMADDWASAVPRDQCDNRGKVSARACGKCEGTNRTQENACDEPDGRSARRSFWQFVSG